MFDKNLFDRNAFDRSVSSDGVGITIIASGKLAVKVVMRTTVPMSPFRGNGDMTASMIARQQLKLPLVGAGELNPANVVLRMPLTMAFSGTGVFDPEMINRVPIPIRFSGNSTMAVSNQFIARQHMAASVSGAGSFVAKPIIQTAIPMLFAGSSEMSGKARLHLPLRIEFNGEGKPILNRIGARNENVIELIGINLLPGETVTIDTDLLQIMFGTHEDVSSVTSDSIFFELFPGENEITVSTDADDDVDVTAIWQNRWL